MTPIAAPIARRRRVDAAEVCAECVARLLASGFKRLREVPAAWPLERVLSRLLSQRAVVLARSEQRYARRLGRLRARHRAQDAPVDVADAAQRAEMGRLAQASIRGLPEPWRSAMEGHYLRGMTRAELALALAPAGSPAGVEWVKERLREGRRMLRESVEGKDLRRLYPQRFRSTRAKGPPPTPCGA